MKRKKILSLLTFAGICTVAIGGVYAYLTGAEHSRNNIHIGSVRTEIKEDFPSVKDDIYKKTVSISNTGQSDCYVRVFLGVSNNEALPLTGFGDSKNGPWYSADVDPNTDGIQNNIFEKTYVEHLIDSGSKWVYIPLEQENTNVGASFSEEEKELLGGWYYYTEALAKKEQTDPLIHYVNTDFTDLGEDKDFDIIIYQEAVQTYDKNGALFTGDNAWLQAWNEYIGSIPKITSGE